MTSVIKGAVQPSRLANLALALADVPGPTLDTKRVAELFADELTDAGMSVESWKPFPESQVVVGRLAGAGDGPTLEFNGHLDHVPVPHQPPQIRDGVLYGRGTYDMKANLASVVEAVRALLDSGIRLRGDVLVTAHGLHEAPGGYEHGEDREVLLREGIHGDACVVVEGPNDFLPVKYGGLTIFEVLLSREGDVSHELKTAPGTPNPLYVGARLANAIESANQHLARNSLDMLGPDSYHLGILEGGDYFNRYPNQCRLVGTRRNNPGSGYEQCLAELEALVEQATAGTGVNAHVSLKNTRDPGEVSPESSIVKAFQTALATMRGSALPLGGLRLATDAPLFIKYGVPTICHGSRGGGAHEDLEWVELASLVENAQLWVALATEFCGVAA